MGRYVHLGCGFSVGPSWENYDASPTLLYERIPCIGRLYTRNSRRFPKEVMFADITKSAIGRIGTADAVYCSHMLEHLSHVDMQRALENVYQMLVPGGIFRLVVPDLGIRVRAYEKGGFDGPSAHGFVQALGMGVKESERGVWRRIKRAFGNSQHRWMYDEDSMSSELERAGFRRIRRCDFGDSDLTSFSEVEDRGRFESELGAELAIECRR